jgi:hypothetical protein
MVWGLVFAGVSAASGLFNAIDESRANRRIVADLSEIKKYLKELRKSIRFVKLQNEEILLKLDELPDRITRIVVTVVSNALLEERYSDLDDIRENFITLRRWSRVSLRGREWSRFSNSMNYVFDHENRISRLLDLITISEFALCITRNRAKSIVILRLDNKIESLDNLKNEFQDRIENQLEKLLIDLNNTKYVKSHNLSPELEEFENLIFEKQPNRNKTEYYNQRVCRDVNIGGPAGRVTRCRNERKSRQIPDTQFHNSRDNYINNINQTIAFIKQQVIEFGQLSSVLNCLINYRNDILGGKSIDKIIELEEPLYFLDTDLSEKKEKIESISYSDLNNFLEIEDSDFEFTELEIENESFNVIIK